jgi:hypothetical protein
MKNFKNRTAYFEIENTIENNLDFSEKIKTVKVISDWASEQMGYDIHEAEAYARSHIANIVRENEVAKMLKRIENDLFDNNIEADSDLMIEKSRILLQNIEQTLRAVRN